MRNVIKGTLTATSSGVEIPIVASLRTGVEEYLIRVTNPSDPTTGELVYLCDSGETAAANGRCAARNGGTTGMIWSSLPDTIGAARVNPKVYAANSTSVHYTVETL